MAALERSYESLQRHGWTINRQVGVVTLGYASVSLCLMIDGRRHVCVPGLGPTYREAFTCAVAEAYRWIERQNSSHPARRVLGEV